MQDIINQANKLLIKSKKTIGLAESCTGGLLGALLTQISGSSRYFILGVITYSNKAKEVVLNIPSRVITQKGAVSKEAASLMAQNIRKIASADFGIGITGIAGPTGGTTQKPVGTVYIAIDSTQKHICQRFHFNGRRITVRKKAALKSLELLINILKEQR